MKTPAMLTHALEYQQPDGTWKPGHLGLSLAEARDMRKIGKRRTGRAVRIVKLPTPSGEARPCG